MMKYLPEAAWNLSVPRAEIIHYAIRGDYTPKAWAQLIHDGAVLYVHMYAEEAHLLTQYTQYNDPVHLDSTMEVFLNPFPELRDDYLNFEINARGTLHLGFGCVRPRGKLWHWPPDAFDIRVVVDNALPNGRVGWNLDFQIPFTLFKELYGTVPARGQKMRGNFYKICGTQTPLRHAGSWNLTDDFHNKDCFGELILE
jgi:hypothetical protein